MSASRCSCGPLPLFFAMLCNFSMKCECRFATQRFGAASQAGAGRLASGQTFLPYTSLFRCLDDAVRAQFLDDAIRPKLLKDALEARSFNVVLEAHELDERVQVQFRPFALLL